MEAFLKELDDEDSPQPVPLEPPGRVTFSFDSSGWLYTYHLGVACCLQQQLLGRGPAAEAEEAVGDFAFSGSSGGALVAAALATGIDLHELAKFVIGCQEECKYNPWRMFPCTERALHRFIGSGAHEQANGRLRVLLTRIQLLSVKPALRPETVSTFASVHHLKQVGAASGQAQPHPRRPPMRACVRARLAIPSHRPPLLGRCCGPRATSPCWPAASRTTWSVSRPPTARLCTLAATLLTGCTGRRSSSCGERLTGQTR